MRLVDANEGDILYFVNSSERDEYQINHISEPQAGYYGPTRLYHFTKVSTGEPFPDCRYPEDTEVFVTAAADGEHELAVANVEEAKQELLNLIGESCKTNTASLNTKVPAVTYLLDMGVVTT